jgi:hypothetical protein
VCVCVCVCERERERERERENTPVCVSVCDMMGSDSHVSCVLAGGLLAGLSTHLFFCLSLPGEFIPQTLAAQGL